MSSSVCQGFQSCLEPPITGVVLKLRLNPSKSNFSQPSGSNSKPIVSDFETQQESQNEQNKKVTNNKEADMGGWSFLQALSGTSESNKNGAEKEKVYVHPLVKRSASKLSKQSLEMCTESLGSETGSDVSDTIGDDFSSLPVESEKFPTRQSSKGGEILAAKRLDRSRSFPPPLTSVSGSTGLQFRPRREGGRLVLEAVTVSSRTTYFHAERSDGRLRLRLVNDSPPSYGNDAEEEEEEEEEEEVEEEGMCFEAEEQVVQVDGIENEDEDEDEDGDGDEENGEMGEEMDGICGNVGGEMGINKLSRPSRCKEGGRGNRGLMNWEPFWVAT